MAELHDSSLNQHANMPTPAAAAATDSSGASAADAVAAPSPAAAIFKRPTPSISTLLTSVPLAPTGVHGKLPPLRGSMDGLAGVAGGSGATQPHSLPPSAAGHGTAGSHMSQPGTGHLPQQLDHTAHSLPGQSQPQTEQPVMQAPQDAASCGHEKATQQQQASPKQSWMAAAMHPREFFLRFSQVQHGGGAPLQPPPPAAAAAVEASGASVSAAAGAAPFPELSAQPQQPEQHWWQRLSGISHRSSGTSTSSTVAVPDDINSSSNNSSSAPPKPSSWPARRLRLLQLLDSPAASWVLIAMSLFVIFQEDFKYAVLPPQADLWFEALTAALLVTFLVEIGLSCVVRPGFFLSFYFWLDTVAVLSLAFELPALRAVLLLGETQEYVNLNNSDSYLMAAGAQALVSSKAGRAAKVVRLFRQLQLIKLFKQLELRQRLKKVLAEGSDGLTAAQAQVLTKYKHSESRVGQRLSDLTMKRVISGILAMLIVLPSLEITSGINGATASLPLGGLEMLHMQALTGGSNSSAFDASLQTFKRNTEYKLAGQTTGSILRLVLANTTYVSTPAYSSIGADKAGPGSNSSSSSSNNTPGSTKEYRRYLEMQAAYFHSWLCPAGGSVAAAVNTQQQLVYAAWDGGSDGSSGGYVVLAAGDVDAAGTASGQQQQGVRDVGVVLWGAGCHHVQSFILLDIKWSLQAQSVYGIARTLFLVCLLGLGSYLIHSDTYRLVLQPVQRMVERVREMAEDPLMLAAVRNTPAMSLSSSGDAASSSNSGGNGAAATTRSSRSLALPHGGGEKQSAIVRASTMAPAAGLDSNKAATTASSKIRFWPSVRVHAVAEGMDAASPGSGASTPLKGSGVVQQRQQLFPPSATAASAAGAEASLPPPRVSGTQLVVAQARRLSAHLVAGVSAAGRAADRLRLQLLQRTTAIKSLLTASDEDDEAGDTAGGQGQYETRLLEQSIYKICALLAVGFGDAGAEVIAENIKQEGDLNPCMPGKKTVAVFGFCDIRRFTDTTEVLQEGVMEFVNVIAHLVHGAVAARGGAANKNIGDAFLLVWKLPKGLDDRDVSLLSTGGGGANSGANATAGASGGAGGGGSGGKVQRTATLNWPGLVDDGPLDSNTSNTSSSSPRHLATLPQAQADCLGDEATTAITCRTPSSMLLHQQHHAATFNSSFTHQQQQQQQASTDKEISHMLQQQHAQLTIKRAASGIISMDHHMPPSTSSASPRSSSPHKRTSGGPSSLSGLSGAGGGGGGGGVGEGGQPEASAHSSSGLRRAMLSIKSVAATPLSVAAKTSIINTIADSALASFVVIQVAITVSRVLKAYSNRADLNARMPGFSVQMGFGLHVGWAIEGAIGSEYKIDASYLSPNVNLASRLEAATKQYSVPMLLSRDFVDCLSQSVRAKVRQIDCVTVKGSNQPLGLFCYDLDLAAAEAELQLLAAAAGPHRCSAASGTRNARNLLAAAAGDTGAKPSQEHASTTAGGGGGAASLQARRRHSLALMPDDASAARSSVVVSAGHNSAWGGGGEEAGGAAAAGADPAEVLLSLDFDDDWVDNPVVAASWAITWEFKEAFDDAFEDYLAGRWSQARQSFEELLCARVNSSDGSACEDPPTHTLLAFMASHSYEAPPGWSGVRELTEK